MKPFDRVLNLVVLAMGLVFFAVVILEMVLTLFLNKRANALPWLLPVGFAAFLLAWAAAVVADRRRRG